MSTRLTWRGAAGCCCARTPCDRLLPRPAAHILAPADKGCPHKWTRKGAIGRAYLASWQAEALPPRHGGASCHLSTYWPVPLYGLPNAPYLL